MADSSIKPMPLAELAAALAVELQGNPQQLISGLASFKSATANDLCFLQSASYLEQLRNSACAAVIVPLDMAEKFPGKSLLLSPNPYLTFVGAIHLLQADSNEPGVAQIHPTAQIAASAQLADDVCIAENCVIGEQVRLGAGVSVAAGCIIEKGCNIGAGSRLHARVTLCHDVSMGENVILHPGVVVGSDGFGLVQDAGRWVKIPHLGSVQIGDHVEVGANTTIDRGALDDTVIENGVKLDNQIQVAHNVVIGENTAIAACVGIAGSAVIGKNCRISGASVVLGHLTIADNVTITAMSLVTKTIPKSGTYSSGTPLLENRLWHRNNARYKMLDKLAKSVSILEKGNH